MINHMNNYMGHSGYNAGYFGFQLTHIFCMIVALVLSIIVLNTLRNRNLKQVAKALWVLISFVPFIGAIAFWIVNPREDSDPE